MKYSTQQGFTLVELMVVIGIIGLLASIALAPLQTARDKAHTASAQLELKTIHTAFEQLYDDVELYPNGQTTLCRTSPPSNNEINLASSTAGLLANGQGWFNWQGPYMPNVEDPWGNPYYLDEDYQCLASTTGCQGVTDSGTDSSVIVSCGPNGAISGDSCDYDADNIVYRLCDTS